MLVRLRDEEDRVVFVNPDGVTALEPRSDTYSGMKRTYIYLTGAGLMVQGTPAEVNAEFARARDAQ